MKAPAPSPTPPGAPADPALEIAAAPRLEGPLREPAHGSPRGLDRRLRASLRAVALAAGVLSLAGLAFAGASAALSVALGGALAGGNLWALAKTISSLLPDDEAAAQNQSRAGWALVAALKMIGLLGVTWLLMRHGFASPLPMLIGWLSLPIGIAIGSLVSDRSGASDDP